MGIFCRHSIQRGHNVASVKAGSPQPWPDTITPLIKLRKGLETNLLAGAGTLLRMDPLSMTASIIAIMQLAQSVAGYLNDIKDASKEQVRIATEISSINALLIPLKSRIKDAHPGDPWFAGVQRLGDKGGSLDQFESTLKQLKSKVEQADGYMKAVRVLTWTFNKTEVSAMLSRIERVKTLVILALANDTL